MPRKYKYQFISAWTDNRGGKYAKIQHSRHGEQIWILRDTLLDRVCDGTGKPIEREEACYSLLYYDKSPNRKARLSVEFVEQLKAKTGEFM